jgi:hypothetical protein
MEMIDVRIFQHPRGGRRNWYSVGLMFGGTAVMHTERIATLKDAKAAQARLRKSLNGLSANKKSKLLGDLLRELETK